MTPAGERYRILRELGRGAMGRVHLARDLSLDREVALKSVSFKAASSDAVRRFFREARLMARVHHPHLVRIFDLEEEHDPPFLTMEAVRGRDLAVQLRERGRLSPREVLRLVEEVGGALDALHRAGIVHRDLKPANLMLREEGGAVLMDLGLARVGGETQLTDTGAIVGTPRYLPPETLGGAPAGPAGDRYQLAMVAYEALTGASPFRASPLDELLDEIRRGEIGPVPRELGIPGGLQEVLEEGLALDPDARPGSGEELALRFRAALEEGEGKAPGDGPSPGQGPSPGAAEGSPWPTLVAAALGLGLGAGLAFLDTPFPEPTLRRMVRIGDQVVATYRSPAGDEVWIESDGRRLPGSRRQRAGGWRLQVELPFIESVARLRFGWPGGLGPEIQTRPTGWAVGARAELVAEGSVELRVRRPCRVRWEGGRAPWAELEVGRPRLSLPPARDHERVLEVEEGGVLASRRWSWEELTAGVLERAVELGGVDVWDETRERLRDGIQGLGMRVGEQHRWGDLVPWFPEVFQGRRGRPEAVEALESWLLWRRSLVYQAATEGGLPLVQAAPGEVGWYGVDPGPRGPGWEVRELLPESTEPGVPREENGVYLRAAPSDLFASSGVGKFSSSTRQVTFEWPADAPVRDARLAVTLHATHLPQIHCLVMTGEGTSLRLGFWNPVPKFHDVPDQSYDGWVTAYIPPELAPDPGGRVLMEVERILDGYPQFSRVRIMRVAWAPLSRP